jgi:hypothetical protein
MNTQGTFEPVFVNNVGNFSATRQKIKLEGKRKQEETECGERVREEQQNITGKNEVECAAFTFHCT